MSDLDKGPRCQGLTKAGKPCRNRPTPGTDRCKRHAEVAEEPDNRGPNERALMTTLAAFGHPEDADAARWQMLRSLAAGVDAAPTRAALWAEYREALSELMKDAANADRSLEDAVAALSRASEVGDTENR